MSEPAATSLTVPDPLRGWLAVAVEGGASDLHLIAGHPPVLRLHGELTALSGPPLSADALGPLLLTGCPPVAADRLAAQRSADYSFDLVVGGRSARFRANLFHAAGQLAACFRVIPADIPDLEWAGFPQPLADRIATLRDGLVVLTGPTGSGKTTTLAMVVNRLNLAGGYRIITVEEPVEYVFPRLPHSVVTQREVGADVPTFADGLRSGLRQDPDVILVGEVRDRETAQMALSAAETGHLVFTTLHTRDAKGAVTRFADLFPQDLQQPIRAQLALGLRAVVSQRLLPGVERGTKRELALEVLWVTHPVASAIRLGKVEGIDMLIVTGRAEGMQSFDESLRQLLIAGRITRAVAEQNVSDPNLLYR
ncbi:type IV pilus twitching motility protein PilT [Urbifossiella limnaea]|uniref:Twitching mobility protein n=1 Tax=Urbifossiella limnaea TaxID=2528023 RepID=A0A517XTM0_9BACT|nr:PilT/PilU family type 4a pilus ATPase [Urbifossiella limnaea]QDU20866.1 Twitching mobility protein [Urbifossiella limnaea]